MSLLIYMISMSLDGFVADNAGNFDWGAPNDEEFSFINDSLRPVGTFLFGRRLYETMEVWETMEPPKGSPMHDFAEIWHSAEKIVFSTTLEAATTGKTQIARSFDAHTVATLKRESDRDICIGGPNLAAAAFKLGLIDECRIRLCPVVIGSGNSAFANDRFVRLELLDQRRFSSGATSLRYRVTPEPVPSR